MAKCFCPHEYVIRPNRKVPFDLTQYGGKYNDVEISLVKQTTTLKIIYTINRAGFGDEGPPGCQIILSCGFQLSAKKKQE